MRLGVLDIGSTAAQLQIIDATSGSQFIPAFAVKKPTRLAECIDSDGTLRKEGVRRAVRAVEGTLEAARRHHVDQLFLFTTSAIRDARNREDVLDRIERRTGLRPQYLTGEDEARLTYVAAQRWFGRATERLLMFDIGGGSLEIAYGLGDEPDLTLSLPLGAGHLTRRFLPDDPPRRRQVKQLRHHVLDVLREATDGLPIQPARAIGASRTFQQLARLSGAAAERKGPNVRRQLSRDSLDEWIPKLARMRAKERACLRGISAPRARQILAGAIVARAMMTVFEVERLDISPWALREGIALRHLASLHGQADAVPLRTIMASREPVAV